MPTQGLSLVGFLDEPTALMHFRDACVMPDKSDGPLRLAWQGAHVGLGAPMPNAGHPDIQPLPPEGLAHVSQLVQQPWVAQGPWAQMILGASWQLVEIDPLLAFQITVDIERSDNHGNGVQTQPAMPDLLGMCLPMAQATEPVTTYPSPGGLLVTCRNLNFQILAFGNFGNFAGVAIGFAVPFVHVVRFNGRCYLHNGFHRAVAARRKGATHVPCLFRDVPDAQSVGINPPGTFALNVLESVDPPTVGHFTQGRAYATQLKIVRRSLHVSWCQYATSDE